MNKNPIAVICGMRAEAALLPREVTVVCTGGRVAKAETEARRLLAEGALGVLSFGIGGGLDPALASGALVIGTGVVADDAIIPCDVTWAESLRVVLSPDAKSGIVASPAEPVTFPVEKVALFRAHHALAVDLESAAVARACAEAKKPFAVIRAVADPAMRIIPRAALNGLTESGRMNPLAAARGLLARPGDLPGLLKLAGETRLALKSLADAARRLGPSLGFQALTTLVDE